MKTEFREVEGVVFVQDMMFYSLRFVEICDKDGNKIPGMYGCLACNSKKQTEDNIYAPPVLIINGAFVGRGNSLPIPKIIEVEKEFDWDDLDEDDIPDDVKTLMSEMSAQIDNSINDDKEII